MNTETEAAKVFDESIRGYTLAGKRLEPWTRDREIAAQAMGMRAPGFTPKDIEAIRSGRAYPGALRDAVIFFWMLNQKLADDAAGAAWTVERAEEEPAEAYKVAKRWAQAEGFADQQSEKWAEAFPLMLAILRGVQVSEFGVKVEGAAGAEKKTEDSPLV